MAVELRSSWVCVGCAVRVYNACHDAIPRPEGWDGDRCIACSREVEEPEDRARRELLTGKAPSRIMVKGVSKQWMRDTQQELIESGDLDPALLKKKPAKSSKPPKPSKPPPAPKPPDPKRTEAERLLREDPAMSNREIGERVGVTFRVVGGWRRKLDLPTSESARRAEATALIAADPTLRNVEVKARMRYPVSAPVIRQVRQELGIAPPTVN